MMRTIKILAALLAVAFASVLSVLPASASIRPITRTVFIDDEHGVLTTPCILHVGEVLSGYGYVTGVFTVTSITADGPVDKVTLSPAPVPPQSSEVLDFKVIG